jgi:glycosyltransferase involved in cell wall biosynthesis
MPARGVQVRVLWFVNKPPSAVTQRLGLVADNRGGWLDTLERALRGRPEIQLAVASEGPASYASFESGGVAYFNLGGGEPTNGVARVTKRWGELLRPRDGTASCVAVVDEFRPDIIHVHGTENPYGLICSKTRTPTVISIQGLLSVLVKMNGRGFDSSLIGSLSPGLLLRGDSVVQEWAQMRRAAERERVIVRCCNNFLGRTRFDQDVVRALHPAARYFHCDEIIRPEFYAAQWCRAALNGPTVYSTSGSYARKGVGTLLGAVALAREAVPGIKLRVGGKLGRLEEEERAARRRIRNLRLDDSVTLLGGLGPGQIAQELCGARVFVLSSHADNSPNALAEAMLVGVPIIASAVGGVPSMARDGVEALLVQDGDPYALAGAILRVLSDDTLAVELGNHARQTAAKRHDPERIVCQLLEIYRELAA